MKAFPGSDAECACGHPQSDHDRVTMDCQAVINTDAFCGCSEFRSGAFERGELNPELRASIRERLDNEWMPDWTAYARCRSAVLGGIGPNRPGMPHPDAYLDDVADTDDIHLPEASVLSFLKDACTPCPVRTQCLAYAYGSVDRPRRFGIFGGAPGRIRERMTQAEANEWFISLATQRGWLKGQAMEGAAS